MENTILDIRLARQVTCGNPELERLIAKYFTAGSSEKLAEFLKSAPASGTVLLELFHEHGGSFGDFVDAVINGKYFLHGVGWNVGEIWRDMWTIGIESARLSILLVRTVPNIMFATFSGFLGAGEENEELRFDDGRMSFIESGGYNLCKLCKD
jgi:hypothetical protein